jgi:hypothetical protein
MTRDTGLTRRADEIRVVERAIARPALPKTTALSPAKVRQVDLEEKMEPLAVAESLADRDRSALSTLIRLALVAATAAAVWLLLPAGRAARPPIELPSPLQEDVELSKDRRRAEEAAIAVLERVGPQDAIDDLRARANEAGASHEIRRFYLGTLSQLGEWAELTKAAADYAADYPDRLEAAHFAAEAIRLTPPEARRDANAWFVGGWFGGRASPAFIARVEQGLRRLDSALSLLQQRDGDWPAGERRKWGDVLHLDRAHLHRVLWNCHGDDFEDPERDRALAALDDVSNAGAENVLALKAEVYGSLVAQWPRVGWERRNVEIDGRIYDRGTLRRELDACREGLRKLPPKGTR